MSHDIAHGDHAHWDTSVWPMVISFGILALVIAFAFQFVYHLPFAAVICIGVGTPLILAGVVGWTNEAVGKGAGLGFGAMGWFILAEAMIFLAMFVSYWVIRLGSAAWPPAGSVPLPQLIPVLMTVTLVASSLTYHQGEVLLHKGDQAGFVRWLLITVVLGLGFLGMSSFEWSHLIHEGFTISTNSQGGIFYSITGLHGSHVLVGLGIFLAGLYPAMKGRLDEKFARVAGLYWHFVDIIWFFVVSQVYFW